MAISSYVNMVCYLTAQAGKYFQSRVSVCFQMKVNRSLMSTCSITAIKAAEKNYIMQQLINFKCIIMFIYE